MVPPTAKYVVLVYFVMVLCLDLLTALWRRRGKGGRVSSLNMLLFCATSEWCSPIFSFHFSLWLSCFPEKSTEEIRILLKVEDDYLNCLMICFHYGWGHRETILMERTAPPWSAAPFQKVNLKLLLACEYLLFLKDPMVNLLRLTRLIQVGKNLSEDVSTYGSKQGHLWDLWLTWDCIQSSLRISQGAEIMTLEVQLYRLSSRHAWAH